MKEYIEMVHEELFRIRSEVEKLAELATVYQTFETKCEDFLYEVLSTIEVDIQKKKTTIDGEALVKLVLIVNDLWYLRSMGLKLSDFLRKSFSCKLSVNIFKKLLKSHKNRQKYKLKVKTLETM